MKTVATRGIAVCRKGPPGCGFGSRSRLKRGSLCRPDAALNGEIIAPRERSMLNGLPAKCTITTALRQAQRDTIQQPNGRKRSDDLLGTPLSTLSPLEETACQFLRYLDIPLPCIPPRRRSRSGAEIFEIGIVHDRAAQIIQRNEPHAIVELRFRLMIKFRALRRLIGL